MNTVIRHTEYLLLRKDCVVLPEIGAFLAQNVSARLISQNNATGNFMAAPGRTFCFNSEISHNDGTLAESVAREKSISIDKASEIVMRECSVMKSELVSGAEISVGTIGTLKYDAESSSIVFRKMESALPTTFSTWFEPIDATPILQVAKQEEEDESAQSHQGARRKPSLIVRFARAAAAVAVLIGVGLALTTPISVDNATLASLSVPKIEKIAQSELIPQDKLNDHSPLKLARSVSEEYCPIESQAEARQKYRAIRKDWIDYYANYNRMIATGKKSVQGESNMHTSATVTRTTTNLQTNAGDSYCIIVASLASSEDAQTYISRDKSGMSLHILECNGKYRVYCATADSSASAWRIANSTSVASHFPGAWVCRR